MKFRQRGVALISIMLVVALATIMAVQMTNEQRLAIQLSANRFDAVQARQYALGGEELARQILREDFEESPGVDLLTEGWASPDLQFLFDDGAVEIVIEDMQGRFNLNQLYGRTTATGNANPNMPPSVPDNWNPPGSTDPDPATPGQPDGSVEASLMLNRLLANLGVDTIFATRIQDWVDPDDGKGQLGAEDFDYLALDPPYRSADQPMMDESELRLLLEMEPEMYRLISGYVAAVPDPAAPLNINTAPAPVLASLTDALSIEAAEALVANREEQGGFESVAAFLQDPALAGSGLAPDGLGVQSGFFRVSVRARFLDRFAYLTSIIQRNSTDGSMRVVYRDMSKRILPVVANTETEETPADG